VRGDPVLGLEDHHPGARATAGDLACDRETHDAATDDPDASLHAGHACRRLQARSTGTLEDMRAIWKGAVSFGLVSVPVKLYSATESHDVSFRQVHAKDGGRIKYQRVCSIDGEEVPYSDIAKGYETEDGEMVILTDDDLANLPTTSSREIAVEKFVPTDQIDPMLFEKSYYLEPESSGAKPYALLRQALIEADRMAVVTVALRQRTTTAVLRVRDDVIVMQTMMWPDEIRTPDFNVETGEVKDAEVKMARMLVETLAGDFEPEEFEDDYAEAIQSVVKAKIEGGEVKRTETSTKTGGEVVDLLAALQRSVEAAKTSRGESDASEDSDGEDSASAEDEEPRKARKAPAKKSAAKKAPAKKTAAKKSAAKKTTTKKSTTKKAAAKKAS
jgi:DNA end-binding protein Ku